MKIITIVVCLLFGEWIQAKWVSQMENKGLYQGDMVLDPDEKLKVKNGFASIIGGRWPDNTVPYEIDKSLGSAAIAGIQGAIEQYHKYTCLKFKPKTTERIYIKFQFGKGCSSPVGYKNDRINAISLGEGCESVGTVIHEIGHTIGLHHEQSRPDRDSYVEIITANIPAAVRYNFDKEPSSRVNSLNTEYDFRSVMHYDATAFGNGKITIKTKNSADQSLIGNRDGFSGNDIQQINLMYNCRVVKRCGDGSEEGKKCGCSKGYCWSKCSGDWWCYTNGAFQSSQNKNYVYCSKDSQCEQGWSCGGTCRL
ncbi:blastula protease 10 [Hydra vulgaris]|uniref:Metalloendopeptidase n=1 Tax=Hydra vulgaris TaxID=6087 RepID=A0ABM4D9F5_HYDVU